MAGRGPLAEEIRSALRRCVAADPDLTRESHASDLFEAYVFTLILRAAHDLGAMIAYEDVSGRRPPRFVFRTSPGYIYSTERQYCHAIIEFPGKPALEVHVGVRVQGSSGVLHECDVAVLFRDEAITFRLNRVPPRQSKIVLAVECKFYSVSIPLGLARGFVGLASDLGSSRDRYFVVNTQSGQAEKYLTNRGRKWEHQLYPDSTMSVDRLRHTFQTSFRDFTAVN